MLWVRDDKRLRFRLHPSSRSFGCGCVPIRGPEPGLLLFMEGRMGRGWVRMNLVVSEAMAELMGGNLDREQRGRLALGWMAVYLTGGTTEEDYRRALGYSVEEWGSVRGTYGDVLERPDGTWGLQFVVREGERQAEVSRSQSEKVSRRYRGIQRNTVVESGIQRYTDVYPTTTTNTEPRTLALSEGFREFWEGYRCERRRNRPAALKEWARQGCEGITPEVLAGLERYRATKQWTEGYMPEPARWLKARTWEDMAEPAEEQAKDPLWDMPRRGR